VLRRRGFGPSRLIREKTELTSRRKSFQIAETLKQLDRTFSDSKTGAYPLDVLLASNMLSVGVDIDRLGVMVMSAQPKTTAEYIQATSRVGRKHPGLVVQVYNWVRPRDISHYERFSHYHDTFYRHVEATSATPYSSRARDRALPAVLTSYMRQSEPALSMEQNADKFTRAHPGAALIISDIASRALRATGREQVKTETDDQLQALADEWERLTSARASRPLVYTGRGLKDQSKTVLLRPMERENARGAWKAAGSLREVEAEVPVVLLPDARP
jgi:superfamily II DNA or RNA helicase